MESPVRICLGAALVVNLLLLSSTTGNAISSQPPTSQDAKPSAKLARTNSTAWVSRNKPRTPDVALNELNPKEQVSEEHTEQNAKYKHRGRVRFNVQSTTTTTVAPKRKKVSTEPSTVMIVTPTPPKKNVTQIIEDMKNYKKNKMPLKQTSSTTPVVVLKDDEEDEDEEDDDDGFERYSSSKYHDFSIPSFSEEDSREDIDKESTNEKELRVTPLQSYSSYFPRAPSFSTHKPPKSSGFFHDFNSDLTTPKNDYFDKRFKEISSSIMKNLASIKATTPTANSKLEKVVRENVNLSNVNKGTPSNKSTVFFKNTKEVRLVDNDSAGTVKQELSDVQGTSIYYEMSVVSTETYAIDNSDDDCDDVETTTPTNVEYSTKSEIQSKPVRTTLPTLVPTRPTYTVNSKAVTASAVPTTVSFSTTKSSTHNSILSTEKSRTYSTSFSRNSTRNSYSKRMNVTGNRAPNSVTPKDQATSNQFLRPTRKFASSTPKSKPVWMAPRRSPTRIRSTTPTTIYSEYFDIKDQLTTSEKPQLNKTSLTTVASDIDPVVQGDHGGAKKVVSQAASDNSIPSLWKRGSVKFSTSTAASPSESSQTSDMEIPPTLSAWALASLRMPPFLAPSANGSHSTQKTVDENELQKVGDVSETKATSPVTTPLPTTQSTSDFTQKIISDINQNKLAYRPVYVPITSKTVEKETDSKSESQPAESNISEQSRVQPTSTEIVVQTTKQEDVTATTVSVTTETEETAETTPAWAESDNDALPPVSSTKSTRFESITKLPSGVTTPQGDVTKQKTEIRTEINTVAPTTTDYEITTITFNYKPEVVEDTTEVTEDDTTVTTYHPNVASKTPPTTIEDAPVTTYRPQYMTTTTSVEETTTNVPETTENIEYTTIKANEDMSVEPLPSKNETENIEVTTTQMVPEITTIAQLDTTSMVIEVVTEINTERQKPSTTTTEAAAQTEPASTASKEPETNENVSEENSGSNEVITKETTKMTTKTTTTEATTKSVTTEPTPLETTKTSEESEQEDKETTTSNQDTTRTDSPSDFTTKSVNNDISNALDYVTTEASRVTAAQPSPEEAGSGAAVAIAVSTIGVIALILLIGLLLVVRRRGRRGVYAQRCTPVSLDAYSLDSVSVGPRKGNQRLRASKRSYGNPAYDDEVTSHPMQYAALANFALDADSVSAEFSEIPSVTVRPEEVPPGCEDKNRYSNVLPLPETRVPLMRVGSDPTTEYINANYVTGPGNIKNYYIACQAPLQNTVADVWRMVWEQNSRLIVMLTEYMENGVEKCYEYLPPSEVSDNKRTFGDFQIILKKREQRDKYAISTIQLINMKTRTWREVTHLWYFWPAKGVPDDYDSILDFLAEMRGYMKMAQTAKEYDKDGVEVIYGDQNRSSYNNLSRLRSDGSPPGNGVNVYSPSRAEELMRRGAATNGTLGRMKAASEIEGVRPCVVMCASGAGRAACVIALDICARALAAGAADVPRVVRELRAQRPHSLANKHHYILLYRVLSEYGNKLMGGGIDTI